MNLHTVESILKRELCRRLSTLMTTPTRVIGQKDLDEVQQEVVVSSGRLTFGDVLIFEMINSRST